MSDIALDHGEVLVLAAAVKTKPEPEPVARIDRGRALVLHHVARHQVAAIGGGVQDHVLRPAFDAAFQHGLQGLVGRILGLERKIIAKEMDETP